MLDRTEDAWDVLFLQELGGFASVPKGDVRTEVLSLSGESYHVCVYQAPMSHHCIAILRRDKLALDIKNKHPFGTGLILECRSQGRTMWLGAGHLPHQQRPDAEEVWLSSLARVDEILSEARFCDGILLGMDLNQNLTLMNSGFPALARLRLLLSHRGLEFNACMGDTWQARNESSCIDWFLFRWPMIRPSFALRDDLRLALPSDHKAVLANFGGRVGLFERPHRPRNGCGRWYVPTEVLERASNLKSFEFTQENFRILCQEFGSRLPSRKYRDPPEIKELLRRRNDWDTRADLVRQISQARLEAQKQHKMNLLQAARQGDRGAISHLRRSATQTFTDGSFIEQLGGQDAATLEMQSFYKKKYSLGAEDYEITSPQIQALFTKHVTEAPRPTPISSEEVSLALCKVKRNTASGSDSICYDAIRSFFAADKKGKLVSFFNRLLSGEVAVPQSWKVGKICFVPKVRRPCRPNDLRPISHTPCLAKIFTRILVLRLQDNFPEYGAGQHACRKGTQVLEAVACAQSALRIFKRSERRNLHVLKLDIRQAFDTLSHQAIWRFLMSTSSSTESWFLWNMCRDNSVGLQLGSQAWNQKLERGVLQGTSFSADLFSRTLDYFLTGVVQEWKQNEHPAFRNFCLPHLLLYADDLLLFGASASELQAKLRCIQRVLSSIGLHINLSKCAVLQNDDGTAPGVWPLKSCLPLQSVEELLYLGVPLAHNQNPMGQLGLSLSKVSASFFSLRKLFDHSSTPVKEKLQLFRSYIAAKWTWCSRQSGLL